MNNNDYEPNWSSIPGHVLATIGAKCKSRVDVLKLRSISPSFFFSVPPPPNSISPHENLNIIFPMDNARDRRGRGHFKLAESTIYAVQPVHELPISHDHQITSTWLIKLEESNKNGKARLQDPLSRIRLNNMIVGQRLPQSLSFLDYRVREITKSYRLELVGISVVGNRYREMGERQTVLFEKVVVSTDEYITLMALISGGQVGVWKSTNKRWALINTGAERYLFEDIAYFENKFYALGTEGLTIMVDPISLHVSLVAKTLVSRGMKCLVKTSKDLFLVDKYWNEKRKERRPHDENDMDIDDDYDEEEPEEDDYDIDDDGNSKDDEAVRLDVYKLDAERKEWNQVNGGELEDNVLFVGEDCTFSLSANEYDACKRNCVYFTDDDFYDSDSRHPGANTGVFDMELNAAMPLSDVPGYSNLLWPPPPWVWQDPEPADH